MTDPNTTFHEEHFTELPSGSGLLLELTRATSESSSLAINRTERTVKVTAPNRKGAFSWDRVKRFEYIERDGGGMLTMELPGQGLDLTRGTPGSAVGWSDVLRFLLGALSLVTGRSDRQIAVGVIKPSSWERIKSLVGDEIETVEQVSSVVHAPTA